MDPSSPIHSIDGDFWIAVGRIELAYIYIYILGGTCGVLSELGVPLLQLRVG